MPLMRLYPGRDLLGVHDEMNRLFDSVFPSGLARPEGGWSLPVDLHEGESGFTLQMDLPGIKPEDVKIRVLDGVLSIEGERRSERPAEANGEARLGERFVGTFGRRFRLGIPVDAANIKATYRAGVLEIHVPRAEEAKPREIRIDVQ